MKRILSLLFMILLGSFTMYGVALKEITNTTISFYNWSQNPYSVAGHQVSVNNTTYDIDNLTLVSGTASVPASGTVTYSGITVPNDKASVVLWFPGTFPGTPTALKMVDFMQFGQGGQPYEGFAIQNGYWSAGEFVSGTPPFIRNNNYTTWGAHTWSSTVGIDESQLDAHHEVAPNPFTHSFSISSTGRNVDISTIQYRIYDVTGKSVYTSFTIREDEVIVDGALLESGFYFISIENAEGIVQTQRIIKQ